MEIQIQKGLPPAAKHIRTEVFVKEQGFCGEFDESDKEAFHFVLYKDGQPAATARLFWSENTWIIGRVAVLKQYRGIHLGTALMERIISFAREHNIKKLSLHAQITAIPFYETLGFDVCGQQENDEGVPHRAMCLCL